ncbi:MAG TPA: RNA polymerase sigma factor [Solirubrobacteraceae bacterium]|jgi:RNA polymerase sigma factor (sigma-70 family)|nr:RNA polymerase sigma factor [Solirubrobacteraceae bacterium]
MRSRSDDIAAYFAEHAPRLERLVRARVGASMATVEDACSYAWLQLLRRDDVCLDGKAAGWLYRVAVHEGWRLAALEREAVTYTPGFDDQDRPEGHLPEPAALHSLDELAAARLRLDEVRALPERERRAVLLFAFGLTYLEIAERMDVTVRTVDRLLRRGRHRIRTAACDEPSPPEPPVDRLASGTTAAAISR